MRPIFAVAVLTGLVTVTFLTLGQVQRRQSVQPRAEVKPVKIYLEPVEAGLIGSTTLKIMINSPEAVGFVSLELNFDPDLVGLSQPVEVVDSRFSTVVKKSEPAEANAGGKAGLTLGLGPEARANPPRGLFALAAVTLAPQTDEAGLVTQLTLPASGQQVISVTPERLEPVTAGARLTLNAEPAGGGGNSFPPPSQPETGTPTAVTAGLLAAGTTAWLVKKYLDSRQ